VSGGALTQITAEPLQGPRLNDAAKYYGQQVNLLLAKGRQAEAGVAYIELGEVLQIQGGFQPAEVNYKKGLELLKRSMPPNDLRLVAALDDLGWLYITWGRLEEGSRLLQQAQSKADKADTNAPGLIRHYDTRAAYLTVIGKFSEAQRDWKRAMEMGAATFGPDSGQYDNVLLHFGQAAALNGNYEDAAEAFRRYLDIERQVSNTPNTSAAVAKGELAHIYTQLHKFPEAQRWFDDAFGTLNVTVDRAPLVHSILLSYLGDFYMAQQNWNEAQSQYRQALQIQQSVMGNTNAVAASMLLLSKALQKLHLKEEAKQLVTRARAILAAEKNPLSGHTVDVTALRQQANH
jgi:tetratricopeptide (TPR) repeat protein